MMVSTTATPREWSCLSCSWTSQRVPDHVVVLFHRCRPDGVRRRLVPLPGILSGDPGIALHDERREWFKALFPVPPAPVVVREPRPTTPPRPTRPPR